MDTSNIKEETFTPPNRKDVEDEDDDPIISEIPVFLSRKTDCYIVQYPVRPATLPYCQVINPVREVKFRPKNEQMEIHMDINTNNANYDTSKGEQFALNVDGDRRNDIGEKSYFKSGLMDKQVLSGGKTSLDAGRYAIGVMKNDEFHITEVKSVMSLRPNLGYLDKSDKRARQEGRIDDPDDPVDEQETKPEAITVKFSKGEVDRAAKWKEKSYQHLKQKQQDEQWVNLRFHQEGEEMWEREMSDLRCSETHQNSMPDSLPPDQYLNLLKD